MPSGRPFIAPCPFCGHPAQEWQASWTSLWRYGCKNNKCSIQPSTPAEPGAFRGTRGLGKQKAKARKMWNTRAEDRSNPLSSAEWAKLMREQAKRTKAFIKAVNKAHKATSKSTQRFGKTTRLCGGKGGDYIGKRG